ncbi:prolyl oligopeptidase family serine peptidase [uncultured Dokdonia sp.]|uniref:alpha/beta hydrolase family protein n=1 Tax=uncultured Dokdonia sp. TaxID=575653 RepID=UPI002608C187|nr:prolyl oligopeptidase family serine peptidase [uncultured Dokdonia sp.]
MRYPITIFLFLMLSSVFSTQAQNGKIIKKEQLVISDSTMVIIQKADPDLMKAIKNVEFFNITYLSDSLKVKGFIVKPVGEGRFPCIISNRGGTAEFGSWNEVGIAFWLGRLASWGYVVAASQYRGNDGGEGKEDWGGKDVNDVLGLVHTLNEFDTADTTRIGMEGASRGGLMTYRALQESCQFKAAVSIAGFADAFEHLKDRPEFEEVFEEYIPYYKENKEKELKARSAVFWADEMCKTTPLLILQGSSDWRTPASQSLKLVSKLYEEKHPVRYLLFEGADHGIRKYRKEVFRQMKRFFDDYVRDLNELPNMELHGR